MQPAGSLQQFAGAGAVGGANQAVALHQVDQMGGAAVADAQPPLQQRRGSLAELEDQRYGVVEERVVFVGVGIGTIDGGALVLGRFEEALDVLGLPLQLPEVDHRGCLLFAHKRRVQAHQTAGSRRQKEHIAAAQ